MAHEVFVCHSSQDSEPAQSICDSLEKGRVRCWIAPRNIPPGMKYSSAIVKAIEECRVVLLVLSGRSNASQHVLHEIELAVNRKRIIIPFRIEDVTLSSDLEYFLSTYQRFDGFPGPLEGHARKLGEYLGRLLKHPKPRSERIVSGGRQEIEQAGGSSGAMTISLTVIALLLLAAVPAFLVLKSLGNKPAPQAEATLPAVPARPPEAVLSKPAPAVATVPKSTGQKLEELKSGFEAEAAKKSDKQSAELMEQGKRDLKAAGVRSGTFLQLEEAELFERTRLAVGMPAPEILGPDAGGKLLRLSDHRKKVVVLGFWTELSASGALGDLDLWLGNRFKDRPVALLGVNADANAAARDLALEGRAGAWKVWLDGKPVAGRWNVRGQPSIFLIDHNGVIRNRFSDHRSGLPDELAQAVDGLIREVPEPRPLAGPSPPPPKRGPPPTVTIAKPGRDFRFRQINRRVMVEVNAEAEDDAPVTDLTILVNGEPAPDDASSGLKDVRSKEGDRWTRRQYVELIGGVNTIEAVAANRWGKSKKAVRGVYDPAPLTIRPPAPPPPQPARLGLIPDPNKRFLDTGVWLSGAHLGTPADKAGIKGNDILRWFNGQKIRTWEDYKAALAPCRPGQTVDVSVARAGNLIPFRITLEAGKED
jgi:peroxiredoxin